MGTQDKRPMGIGYPRDGSTTKKGKPEERQIGQESEDSEKISKDKDSKREEGHA